MANILLLEDDPVLTAQLGELLSLEGHAIVPFDAVQDALRYLEENPVDLIIADIFIDGKSGQKPEGGVTLISYVKQIKSSNVPILAISGAFLGSGDVHDTSPLVRDTAFTVGASAVLAKPFRPQELLGSIAKLLHGQMSERQDVRAI